MRILYYNWAPINSSLGGGVSVYQKSLLDYFNRHSEHEIYYLSSGYNYTPPLSVPYIKEEKCDYGNNIHAYTIINSPVFSPMSMDPKNIYEYLSDESLARIFDDFIESIGGVDIIHFNNIEGLTLKCIEIKRRKPNIRVFYSAHNYFLVCPEVMLWKHSDGSNYNCDTKTCDECARYCKPEKYNFVIGKRLRNSTLKKITSQLERCLPRSYTKELYMTFLEKNRQISNDCFDCIFAVSERVRKILIEADYNPSRVKTMYIGTKVASEQISTSCCSYSTDSEFRIAYLGYMASSKGFYFFLNAMEKMDDEIASHVSLKICARHTKDNKEELQRIECLHNKFKEVELHNGFSHDNEKELLSNVNLGVVPVLWEDNLPQVLIEQISYGVPVLVSDLGGGQEIVNNNSFVFRAGDTDDFLGKITSLYNNPSMLSNFWTNSKKLVTCDEHLNVLLREYQGLV